MSGRKRKVPSPVVIRSRPISLPIFKKEREATGKKSNQNAPNTKKNAQIRRKTPAERRGYQTKEEKVRRNSPQNSPPLAPVPRL